jgi:Fic family protein
MTTRRKTGDYVTVSTAGETCRAFVPNPLPPDPPLRLSLEDLSLVEQANQSLGRLDGLSLMMPDPDLLLYMYIRKEAVLSSQIEGTQSSLSDLLMYEHKQAPGVPLDDVQEVSRYVAAIQHGLARVEGGFPLSLRLIREIHEVLLAGGRGGEKSPGEFRRSQNWVGGSRPGNAAFVPPPPERVAECLGALERFLHDEPGPIPTLIKSALAHVQFETIHPFLDGNGRVGRLLIPLILCTEKVLQRPLLYLSLYFKQHREDYYRLLGEVRTDGNWEGWLRFFLTGVGDTCRQAIGTAQGILGMFERDAARIEALGRPSGSVLRVFQQFKNRPLLDAPETAAALGLAEPTVRSALGHLIRLGIVRELTGRERHRVYCYDEFVRLLNEDPRPQ